MTPSTRGYAEGARELIERYESIPFEEKHRAVLHLIPSRPCRVLDIGAGSGVDAAWFAQRGHRVVAVEPVKALRLAAMALHPSPRIEWVDDHLPGLARMRAREETFDLVSPNKPARGPSCSRRWSATRKSRRSPGQTLHARLDLRVDPDRHRANDGSEHGDRQCLYCEA